MPYLENERLIQLADDPKRYRSDDELREWSTKDPLALLKLYLLKRKLWDESTESDLAMDYEKEISAAVERQESLSHLPPEELIFEDVYSKMPENLKEQRDEFLETKK